MPAVEMMLGHAPAAEQVAWQALENGALKPAPLEKIGEEDTNKENDAPEKIDAGVRMVEKVRMKKLRPTPRPR